MSYEKLADNVPLTDDEIRSLADWEFENGSDQSSSALETNLEDAYRAYHNELEDETERENLGKSIARSSDVSDAIEWILPQIVRSIIESPEAVRFEPLSPLDEEQAGIEADATHYYLLSKCDGFVVVYSAAKDALLCKNCVTATYYQERTRSWQEKYQDLTEVELADLLDPDNDTQVSLEAVNERQIAVPNPNPLEPQSVPQVVYDITLRRKQTRGEIVVSPVPIDKFRVRKNWSSVVVDDDTPFCGYETTHSASDLVEMGYAPEIVDDLPSEDDVLTDTERERQDVERDTSFSFSTLSRSQRQIKVIRCYMVLDVNGDGFNERIWVTLAGNSERRLLGWEEVPENPFSTGAVMIQPHKFYGVSVYDKLRYIQDQKTKILQMLEENLDQQNDPPKTILEGAANLDDILDGRATGRTFRIREPNAVQQYPVPIISQSASFLLDYLDKRRTERVGADPGMQSIASAFPEESMNSAVERLMAAREEMVALMVRALAETWLKDLFLKIRGAMMRNLRRDTLIKLRNRWYQINPGNWVERTNTVVKIGLGAGDQIVMRNGMMAIRAVQDQLKQTGGPVPYSKIYQAVSDLARSWGREPSDYFVSPTDLKDQNSPVAQEVQQEAKAAQQAAEQARQNDPATKMAEATIAAEQLKAQVKQMEAATQKEQGDQKLMTDMMKFQEQMQLEQRKLVEDMRQQMADLEFKYRELAAKTGVDIAKITKDDLNIEKEGMNADAE